MRCPTYETWLEALDGGLAAPDGAHADCPECRRNRESAERMLGLMREAVAHSTLSDEAFVRRVMGEPRKAYWIALALAPAVAAAAALLLWVSPSDAPVARGGAICEVREVTGKGLRPATGQRLPPRAPLAFAVKNPGAREQWLGIFAVTGDGRVAWYYPAYESAGDDPELLRLRPGSQILKDQVSLPLGPGEVRVFCWLSERPWQVRAADEVIERAVAGAEKPTAVERIPALGGRQESHRLWFGE